MRCFLENNDYVVTGAPTVTLSRATSPAAAGEADLLRPKPPLCTTGEGDREAVEGAL